MCSTFVHELNFCTFKVNFKRMRNKLLATVLVMCLAGIAQGQDNGWYHGVLLGGNEGVTLDDANAPDGIKIGVAMHGGYKTQWQFIRWGALEMGLLPTVRSAEIKGSILHPEGNRKINYHRKIHAASVNLYALPKFRYGKGPTKYVFMAGMEFNYLISVGQSMKYFNSDFNNTYGFKDRKIPAPASYEFGAIVGAGVEFPIYANGVLSFDYRHVFGLSTVGDIGGATPRFQASFINMSLLYKPRKKKKS